MSATPGSDAIDSRRERMRQAQNAYDGTTPNLLIVRTGEPDDNVKLPFGRLIVDKGVSFLFGQDVQSQVETQQATAGSKAPGTPLPAATKKPATGKQDWLDECWRRNKRALTLSKLATTGGITGHVFARLLEKTPFPRVVVIDPQTVAVSTAPDDIDDVWRYIITPPAPLRDEGDEDDPDQIRTIIQTNRHAPPEVQQQTWTITDQRFSAGAWIDIQTVPWRYNFSPIVECQNLPRANDYWGESDLPRDILHTLQSINRVASNINKILRIHAHPKVFTTGMGNRAIDVAIDSVINLPSESSMLRTLEMQSDLGSSLTYLDKLLNYFSMITRIPLVAMGMPDNLGAISGVALAIRYQPLLEKTQTKRRTYGDMITELDRRLLALGGFGDKTITQLIWHDMLPTDALQEIQVMVIEDSLGVRSKKSIADALNLNYESEMEQMGEEAALAAQKAQSTGLPLTQTAPGQPAVGGGPQSAQPVPPPAPFKAPLPDIAKTGKSR